MLIVEITGYYVSDRGRWESLLYFRVPTKDPERKQFFIEFPLSVANGVEKAIEMGEGLLEMCLTAFDELKRDAMPKGWSVGNCTEKGTKVFSWRKMVDAQQRMKGVNCG